MLPVRRTLAALAALFLTTMVLAVVGASPAQAATTAIAVNGSIVGRTFDGVGAISGGGGNSRLLIDYPPAQRSQILDYLFKPGYGAAVQLLKLEIGGAANSTDGSEPSHQHVRGDINCNVGYEFWLGEQAVARNPNIKLVALPWTAPGWIGNHNFWSQDMIDYDLSWLNCAKQPRPDDQLPRRLERARPRQDGWYENLRSGAELQRRLRQRSRSSATTAAGAPPTDMRGRQRVQQRRPGGRQPLRPAATSRDADHLQLHRQTPWPPGKPLWASEFGSQDDNAGVWPIHPDDHPRLPRRGR